MIKPIRLLTIATLALAPLQLPAQTKWSSPLETPREQLKTRRITVIPGKEGLDAQSVIARLKTKENEPFSHADFDADLKALAKEYDRVIPTVETEGHDVYIQLKVWPKPLIRSISYVGNQKLRVGSLNNQLGIKPPGVFDRRTFNEAFHKLREYYVKKGYFEARLSYDVNPDAHSNEVDIVVHVDEGRSGWIDKIEFNGLTKDEESDLIKRILTKEYSFFFSWFTDSGVYKKELVDQDRLIILNHMNNLGYADATCSIRVEDMEKKNRIKLAVDIEKGPIYKVGAITWEGNELFSDEQIKSQLLVDTDQSFSPEKVRASTQRIRDLYGRKGYIDALVYQQPVIRADEPVYDLHIKIEEGEQFRIGLIKVIGNQWTQPRVILHETLLIPGETFDTLKLRQTEQRLFNIGYFESVNVYAVDSSSLESLGANYRDVVIEVAEQPTGSFGFSAGFSTQEAGFVGFNITERNFNYKGLPSLFSEGLYGIRGGGEYLHARFNAGTKSKNYVVSWTKPYIWDTPWILSLDYQYLDNETVSDKYTITTNSFRSSGQYPINEFLRYGTYFRYTNSKVDIRDLTTVSTKLQRQADNDGCTIAVGSYLAYDSTDHPVRARQGLRSTLKGEYAGFGGDYSFWHFSYINSLYVPVLQRGVVKFRADLQMISPQGSTTEAGIPLHERFFLGGDTTIRGYEASSVGPRFAENEPEGGISSTLLSAEFAYQIHPRVEGFVFADAGDVNKREYNVNLRAKSVGAGTRIKVLDMLPPITLGYGIPINEPDNSIKKEFFLTLSGNF